MSTNIILFEHYKDPAKDAIVYGIRFCILAPITLIDETIYALDSHVIQGPDFSKVNDLLHSKVPEGYMIEQRHRNKSNMAFIYSKADKKAQTVMDLWEKHGTHVFHLQENTALGK